MADLSSPQRVYPDQPYPTYYPNRSPDEVHIEMDNLPAHPQAYATQSHPYQPAASGTPKNQGQDASTPRAFSWPATKSRLRRFTTKLSDFLWEHVWIQRIIGFLIVGGVLTGGFVLLCRYNNSSG
ncbi:hypothetical protein BJX66DRAFT_337384 [Aspergillus keveii]|uniref:Uncharacterized protein n=1 Tax=Aspergillus keveii TaxID=714993 RepID=A0ABR4G7H0_9EURO